MTIKHQKNLANPDSGAEDKVYGVDWEADHTIENDSIQTAHINDLAITTAKIAANAVTLAKTGDIRGSQLQQSGLDSSKPAAGTAGRVYWAMDTKILYLDDGASWSEILRGETATRLAQLSEKSHNSLTDLTTGDPHTQYQKESEKDAANGYAGLDASTLLLLAQIPNLPTSRITSGRFTLARLPDGALNYVLKGQGVGSDPVYGQVAHSELTGVGSSDHHAKTGDDEVYGLLNSGVDAGKGAAGTAGKLYWATDTLKIYRDNGVSWDVIAVLNLNDLTEKSHDNLTGLTDDDHTQYVLASGTRQREIPNPASDQTATGDIQTETAGENVVFGDLCYLKSDGKFWKADADAGATCDSELAVALETITANNSGDFLLYGKIRDDAAYNWTVGGKCYVSTTAGSITQTAPSVTGDIVRIVGYGHTADILFFNPDNSYVEIS